MGCGGGGGESVRDDWRTGIAMNTLLSEVLVGHDCFSSLRLCILTGECAQTIPC